MPVYEFRCNDCSSKFDIVASIEAHDRGLETVCPKCGSRGASQVFGRFTVLSSSKTEDDDFDSDVGDDLDGEDYGGG